jgi:hypothetical protein
MTTKQAQIIINQWLRQYNHIRPHQAPNMQPPVPETLIKNGTEPRFRSDGFSQAWTPEQIEHLN